MQMKVYIQSNKIKISNNLTEYKKLYDCRDEIGDIIIESNEGDEFKAFKCILYQNDIFKLIILNENNIKDKKEKIILEKFNSFQVEILIQALFNLTITVPLHDFTKIKYANEVLIMFEYLDEDDLLKICIDNTINIYSSEINTTLYNEYCMIFSEQKIIQYIKQKILKTLAEGMNQNLQSVKNYNNFLEEKIFK